MIIKKIINPLTNEYFRVKEIIHSNEFPWFYQPSKSGNVFDPDHGGNPDDLSFYSHKIVERPSRYTGTLVSKITSELFSEVQVMLNQIFQHNGMSPNVIYRINLNVTSPCSTKKSSYHVDLEVPHNVFIIYMSDFDGGETYVIEDGEEKVVLPEEDDILLFDGSLKHSFSPPSGNKRRIVMVVNFY